MNKDKSKKYINFRTVGLVLSSCILTFVVFTLYLYPILTSKKEDIIIGDENVVVGDEPPIDENIYPFIWKASPENSFGYSGEYVVNWSWIEDNVVYSLTRDGIDVSDNLVVNFSYVFTNRKYSYEFTSESKGYFEMILVFDSKADSSYINGSSVFLNYSYGVLFYNYSDISSIQQIDFDVSLVDNVFTMTVGRQCNKNVHVVLDPFFGDKGTQQDGTTSFDDTDDINTAEFFCSGSGTVTDMGLYIRTANPGGGDADCRGIIYDSSLNFVGQTEEFKVTSGDGTWYYTNIIGTPSVSVGNYFLGLQHDGSDGLSIPYQSGGIGILKDDNNGNHYPNYPATLTNDTWVANRFYHFYANYTEGGGEATNQQLLSGYFTGGNNSILSQLSSGWFSGGNESITITLIDHMPSNLRTNNTGEAWFLYNITTSGALVNYWSIVWAYSVNHTLTGTYNTSYSLEDHLAEDKLRGINRNVNNTIETKFNSTTGDGSIGGFGEWNTHDGNKNITLVDSGSNWTLVNATEVIAEHLFNSISFVDIEELAIEDKTLQTIEISKTNFVKIVFNMTDTDWYDSGHYKNTSMFFHVYANQTNANKPLDIFYANNNYTTGDLDTSQYCELVSEVHQDDAYHFNEYNSSYYEIDFNINETGFVGGVDATSNFSIILRSKTPSTLKWYLHYADDNISHTLDGDIHYHDFDNRTIMTISSDSGASWTGNNSTPDAYFNYISLDEEDVSEVKLYANDTSGNEGWSSVHTDLIDITNYPPSPANIIVPNVDTNYTVGDTIPINYHWIGDPNMDTCWVNISLWDWDITTLDTHIINQSITQVMVSENNSNFTYNWDTTGITVSNYTIAINITDPYMLWANSSSDIFYIWSSNAQLFSGYFSGGNLSVNTQLLSGWFSGGNVSGVNQQIVFGWFSGGNISVNAQLLSGWFSGGNTSVSAIQQVLSGYFTGGNVSINSQLLYGWFSGGNTSIVTVNQQLLFGWFSGGNTSIVNITITDEYPGNGSISIPLQPTVYVTINSGDGDVMNITWYYGTTLGAENIEVGTDNNITNGSYTELYYPITGRVTTYYWRVMLSDGNSYINESFSFTTEGFPIAPRPPSIGLAVVGIIFGTLGLLSFVMFSKKKKKKKRNEYMYMEEEEWLD